MSKNADDPSSASQIVAEATERNTEQFNFDPCSGVAFALVDALKRIDALEAKFETLNVK